MTIDECINHCEEVAEEKESICNVIENEGETWTDSGKIYYDVCKKCASEHRQLAEWLKELKAWREAEIVQTATDNTKTLIFNKENYE